MRRTKAKSEATRQTILSAALDEMVGIGYAETTLEGIAARAGVTRGAIYWHFSGKEELYNELLGRLQGRLDGFFEAALTGQQSPFAKVQALTRDIIRNFYENTEFNKFIELTWVSSSNHPSEKDLNTRKNTNSRFIDLVESLLQEAQTLGEVSSGPSARLLALQLDCLINGLYRLFFMLDSDLKSFQSGWALFETWFDSIQGVRRG